MVLNSLPSCCWYVVELSVHFYLPQSLAAHGNKSRLNNVLLLWRKHRKNSSVNKLQCIVYVQPFDPETMNQTSHLYISLVGDDVNEPS